MGDIVRLSKNKLWAVCIRAATDEAQLIDLVVQSGMKPGMEEPEDSVIVVHAFDRANVAAVMEPIEQATLEQ